MECGACELEYDGVTMMACAPIDFLTPFVSITARVDDLILNEFNTQVKGNMTNALALLDENTLAGNESRRQISAAASAILSFPIEFEAVDYICTVKTRFRCTGTVPTGFRYIPEVPPDAAAAAIPEACESAATIVRVRVQLIGHL